MIKLSYEYENHIQKNISQAVNAISKGDVFGQTSHSLSVSFEHDKLQSVDDVTYSSIACRVFENGQVGNAFVNDPNAYKVMIDNAQLSARFGEKSDITLPSLQPYQTLEWMNAPRNLSFSKQDLKDIAQDLLSKIKEFAPNAKVSTGSYASYNHFFLENTAGFIGDYQETGFTLQGGLFELGSDGSFIELYEGYSYYDQEITFEHILTPLQNHLELSRMHADIKTGHFPVIVAPSALELILSPIDIAVNGKTLVKNLSMFSGKLGEKLFDEKFSLTDDPFYKYGSASAPFDDEGYVGESIPLISSGVFENFIFDLTTAQKIGTHSTGSAGRGSSSLPVPKLSNTIIGTGNHSLEHMIKSVDYGLLLIGSLGEGQSNVIAGDFSVLTETAYLIQNGELKGRVKDVMLSGNSFDILKNIPMIENVLHQESSLFAPHILLEGISIVSK